MGDLAEADLLIKGEVKQGACHDPLGSDAPARHTPPLLSAHVALALPRQAQAWGCSSSGTDMGFQPAMPAAGELVCGGRAMGACGEMGQLMA